MNDTKQIILLVIALGVIATGLHAQESRPDVVPPLEARITSSVETPEVAESVTLKIEITFNQADVRLIGVEWDDADFERLAGLPSPTTKNLPDGRTQYVQSIPARTWEIDEAAFGPVTIEYDYKGERKKSEIEPLKLKIKSLIADEANATIGDIRTPMIVPPPPYAMYAIIAGAVALALLALTLLIVWLKRRSGRIRAPAPRPLGPPDLEALAAIDALMDSDLLEQGELKEFFTRLGDIMREYLFRRFGMPAHELTSYEIMLAFDAAPELGKSQNAVRLRDMLNGVFELSDLVKFAKHRPERTGIEDAVDLAREFIVLTRPRLAAPVENQPSALAGTA